MYLRNKLLLANSNFNCNLTSIQYFWIKWIICTNLQMYKSVNNSVFLIFTNDNPIFQIIGYILYQTVICIKNCENHYWFTCLEFFFFLFQNWHVLNFFNLNIVYITTFIYIITIFHVEQYLNIKFVINCFYV